MSESKNILHTEPEGKIGNKFLQTLKNELENTMNGDDNFAKLKEKNLPPEDVNAEKLLKHEKLPSLAITKFNQEDIITKFFACVNFTLVKYRSITSNKRYQKKNTTAC